MNGIIASIVRFLLVALGGWFVSNVGVEIFQGDADATTVLELVYGLILAGLAGALKFISGLGSYGKLAETLIGPRVQHIAHSLSRWVVGLLAGAAAGLTDPATGEALLPDLGDQTVTGVVIVLVGFAFDRVSKFFRP